eukprot:5430386-Amphidinium_carterae.1
MSPGHLLQVVESRWTPEDLNKARACDPNTEIPCRRSSHQSEEKDGTLPRLQVATVLVKESTNANQFTIQQWLVLKNQEDTV